MTTFHEIKHAHMFCGLGGGAKGFNQGNARVGNVRARFRCLGGIDIDRAAIRDFERLSGVRGTVLDLFDRDQYTAFFGNEPPSGWRPASMRDVHAAFGHERPDVLFTSPPCKGFSGLLSESKSRSGKYQALNGLTLRGIWLALEAYRDDPVPLVILENVPRIATRGRGLLDQIVSLLRSYGYAVAETTHDCGEIGGLAQSRKRFLLVARHVERVPSFLYQPVKQRLRAVGDVLSRMSRPDDPMAGPMHRLPRLQWKTWVRLAFVEAGSDWRSLNRLAVENGFLRDFGIVPELAWRKSILGVLPWDSPSACVTGRANPTTGCFSVADPTGLSGSYAKYAVTPYDEASGTVISGSTTGQGAFAVADPAFAGAEYGQYGVLGWDESMGAVSGQNKPGGGRYAVADPRPEWMDSRRQADAYENIYRVVPYDDACKAVTGASHTAGGALSVADPCTGWSRERCGHSREGAYGVIPWNTHSNPVTAKGRYDNSSYAIADPLPGLSRDTGDNYLTAGHYGVRRYDETCGAVSASACHDNGFFSVADIRLPEPSANLSCCIIAPDNTWHRPFTTLELAALQGLVDPEEQLELDGLSDAAWRERIGNAVPPPAAQAIAGVMGEVLILTALGETFSMSPQPVWVQPVIAGLMAARLEHYEIHDGVRSSAPNTTISSAPGPGIAWTCIAASPGKPARKSAAGYFQCPNARGVPVRTSATAGTGRFGL